MAGSSLLALIDDIAAILDDVAAMSKVAVKKTAGVLGDDLALNAEQVTGVDATRELPVVWAVARGSLINKIILVPAALLLSSFLPFAITPLLMLGGLFLCYEGCEKLAQKFFATPEKVSEEHAAHLAAIQTSDVDIVAVERDKIRGAIRTYFILSAEIVIITLGTLAEADFTKRVMVLISISLLMTIGVYGLVAGIVKIDDLGYRCRRSTVAGMQKLGDAILWFAPNLLKLLSIAGTLAMFLVGGGILTHGIPSLQLLSEDLRRTLAQTPGLGSVVALLTTSVIDALVGLVSGAVVLALVIGVQRLRKRAS